MTYSVPTKTLITAPLPSNAAAGWAWTAVDSLSHQNAVHPCSNASIHRVYNIVDSSTIGKLNAAKIAEGIIHVARRMSRRRVGLGPRFPVLV
jgi:hypothetical protein